MKSQAAGLFPRWRALAAPAAFLPVAFCFALNAASADAPNGSAVFTPPPTQMPAEPPPSRGFSGAQYVLTRYTSENGLLQNTVRAITQDTNGALWVATLAGLARFDGNRFVSFDHGNTPVFGGDAFNALAIDRVDGSLWIGGGDGIYRYWRRRFEKIPKALHGTGVFRLWPAAGGGVWFDCGTGELGRVLGTNVFFHRFAPEPSTEGICLVGDDGSEEVRVAANHSLLTCDRKSGLLSSLASPGWVEARSAVEESPGNLWAGTKHGLIHWAEGRFLGLSPQEAARDAAVDLVYRGQSGFLWAWVNGRRLCRMVNGSLLPLDLPALSRFDDTVCLYEDRERTLWIGTEHGLVSIRPRRVTALTQEDGLVDDEAWSVCEGPDGTIFFATVHGVATLKPGDPGPRPLLSAAGCKMAWMDSRGELWVEANGWKLWRNNVLTDALEGVPHPEFHPVSILDEPSGGFWFGGRGSLLQWGQGRGPTHFFSFVGPEETPWAVKALHRDREGVLWLGTYGGGLRRFVDGKFASFRAEGDEYENRMWTILEDANGVFWIGSEAGLHRFENGRFFSYHATQGMPEPVVNHVLEDDDGFLWISGLKGIYRMAKAQLNEVAAGRRERINYLALGEADGMLSPETNGENGDSACKTKDGRLWFPTAQGVVVIDPRLFLAQEPPPPVVIEEVRVDDQLILGDGVPNPVLDGDGGPGLVQAAERNPAPRELRFAPGQAGVIDVTYTANSFAAPGKVRFKYRLLGQATNWFEMGARRGAVFPNLPPGSYRFEVTACNSHGVWQPVPAGFSFAIAPHFYQTWVFYVLCGAMVVAAGGLIQRWRLQIQRKIAALEGVAALERERSRIARDLHDELGAGLAQVVLLSDAPSEHVPAQQKPRDVAREMMQKLDGIVWSLNPERAEAGSIVDYLAGFAEKFIAATPMQLHLDLPQNQPTLALAPSQRHDLLLAFKEMLRNAVTHSHGTAITVRIAFPGESMEVAVRDDGVGFDPSSRPPHRNGLSNLEQRAASLGGTFEIRSAPGQGTEAILTFPMKHQPAP